MSHVRQNFLSDLPADILSVVKDELLSHSDTINATKASKTLQTLFKPETPAAKLLHAVTLSDYDRAEALMSRDIGLIFKEVSFQHANGRVECISPLKYAFKVYDTYMWQLFLSKIEESKELKEDEKREFKQAFIKQAYDQKEHLDLAPLLEAYKEYDRQYTRWLNDEIKGEALDQAWLALGVQQREVLPWHMLKEFCRKGDSWSENATFSTLSFLKISKCDVIYNWDSRREENLLRVALGVSYSLVRGGAQRVLASARGALFATRAWSAWLDSAIFRRLCEVRMSDLASQLSLLESSQKTLEFKS